MRRWLNLASLRTRIVVLTAVPPCLLLLGFLTATLRTVNHTVDAGARRSLTDAGSVFVKLLATRQNELLVMANVTARDPRFFATVAIPADERGPEFAPTVAGVARDFLRVVDADFIEVFDNSGRAIARVEHGKEDVVGVALPAGAAVRQALGGTPSRDFDRDGEHLLVAGVAPVFVGNQIAAVLRLGSIFDRDFVEEVTRLSGAQVCLTDATGELASTFAPLAAAFAWPAAVPTRTVWDGESFQASEAFTLERGDVRHLVVRIRIAGQDAEDVFDAFLGRDLATEVRPMIMLTKRLAAVGGLAILATGLVAWMVARRIVRPVAQMVAAASALQRGDYDYGLEPRGGDEIAFLGRSFLAMRGALHSYVAHLKSVDQMKSDFIAVAAHELKTPLTVISSFNEMIVSGVLGDVPEPIREPMRCIQERLWDLNRLVGNMLDLSRSEQGLLDLVLERFDLRERVEAAIAARRADFGGRRVEIHCDGAETCPIVADRKRIEQAFGHLLDNAIRFTPDGGMVSITIGIAAETIELEVRDTGIGIAARDLDRIFDKSHTLGDVLHHSSGRLEFGSRGLGLGLALCKAIVAAHGGGVRVASIVGRGSVFTMSLPAPAAAATGVELVPAA
jgi:signal transduction histidine kinase